MFVFQRDATRSREYFRRRTLEGARALALSRSRCPRYFLGFAGLNFQRHIACTTFVRTSLLQCSFYLFSLNYFRFTGFKFIFSELAQNFDEILSNKNTEPIFLRAGLERSLKVSMAGGALEDRSVPVVGEALEELWLERGMARRRQVGLFSSGPHNSKAPLPAPPSRWPTTTHAPRRPNPCSRVGSG